MVRPATTRGPAAVERYLLPREARVATVRKHPAVLIPSSALAVAGLLAAAVLTSSVLRGQQGLDELLWLGVAILMANLIWQALNWAVDYFVITSERLILTSGVFTRKVAMMPMSKVTDMSFQRSFAGRLLGYGEFIVESAGQEQALRRIDHIPYPEQLYLVVCGRLFPTSADDAGPPGGDAGGPPFYDPDEGYDQVPDETLRFSGGNPGDSPDEL
jgi:Bacterial PH domain